MLKKPKNVAPIHAEQSVSEAFATILRHNFNHIGQWEQAARSWEDIEGVHQVRVAFRRMRSALSAFRSAVPKDATAAWADDMRWLAGECGPARDLDVFIDEGLEPLQGKLSLPGADEMMAVAGEHRAMAYETVRRMLDSERYARFKTEFPDWLARQGWSTGQLSQKHRKRLAGNVVPYARTLLDTLERRVLSTGSHVDQDAAADMHSLRIECKKLRYAAEFFYPLFAGMDEFIGHMKGLQDLLGVMNDVAVMGDLLNTLLAEEKDSALLQYAGGLVGWRTRQYHEIKGSFNERWDEFVQAKHPWWKRSALMDASSRSASGDTP